MKKKIKEKRYALIKKGAITPIITGTKEEMDRLWANSSQEQQKLLLVEEVLN